MKKYLLELVQNNSRVIIPNFGAFIISKEHGLTILFNNYLSFNDGLLVNYVAEKEQIETVQALEKVSQYVEEVKSDLDKKGSYTIEGLGKFVKEENEALKFIYEAEEVTDSVKEEVKEKAPKTSKSKENDSLLDIDQSDSEVDKVIDATPEETSEKTEILDIEKNSEPEKTSEDQEKTSSIIDYEIEEKEYNQKKNIWIAIAIAIPIIAVIAYFLFFKSPKKEKVETKPQKEIVAKDTLKPQIDSTKILREQAIKDSIEAATLKAQQELEAKKKFHLIVGSFEKESNADKLVKKLKADGLNDAFKFQQGKFFMVSATSFESFNQCMSEQEKFLEERRMESWIMNLE